MSSTPSSFRRPRTLVIAAVTLVVVVLGGWIAINAFQGDAPERLSFDDLATTTTADGGATTTTASGEDAGTDSTAAGATGGATTGGTTAGSSSATGVDGTWEVTSGSQAGYRVKEVLFGQDAEAVGRTEDVAGGMVISGTKVTQVEMTVDMTTVASDKSQRDGQFRGRIMSVDQFPTATFDLTKPIDFGSLPADGKEITVSATGDLTLRGVTKSVTFDLKAKRTGDKIAVNGTIPVAFDDYAIPDASGGPATVGRNGELEFLLVFAK